MEPGGGRAGIIGLHYGTGTTNSGAGNSGGTSNSSSTGSSTGSGNTRSGT